MRLSCNDYCLMMPGAAGHRRPLAPNLAPRGIVSFANVSIARTCERNVATCPSGHNIAVARIRLVDIDDLCCRAPGPLMRPGGAGEQSRTPKAGAGVACPSLVRSHQVT